MVVLVHSSGHTFAGRYPSFNGPHFVPAVAPVTRQSSRDLQLPRPWRTAFLAAAPLTVPLLLGELGVLSALSTALAAAPLFVFAIVRVAVAWDDVRMARGLAVRLLRFQPAAPPPPLAVWRAEEFTSRRLQRRRWMSAWPGERERCTCSDEERAAATLTALTTR